MPAMSQEETAAYQKSLAAIRSQDAAVPAEDAAVPAEDAAVPAEDAAVPAEDAAVVEPPTDRWDESLKTRLVSGFDCPAWCAKAKELTRDTGHLVFPNLMWHSWEETPVEGFDSFQVVRPGGGETSATEAEIRSGKFKSGTPIWG